jgi:hypothetical protein
MRAASHTASLVEQVDRGDLSVYTISLSASGIWTLVVHADGIDILTSPSGKVINLDSHEWPSASPQVAAIQAWMANEVDGKFAKHFQGMVDTDQARWILDPEVEGVYGLQRTEDHAILLVIYRDGEDFEVSTKGDREVYPT